MATPLEGCEVDSLHGGSIIITSNYLPPIYNCFYSNLWKSNLVTSAQIGTALSPTYDLDSVLEVIYLMRFIVILKRFVCILVFFV